MTRTEWICTQCYEIDLPIKSQRGSWPLFIAVFIGMGLFIIIPAILWLAFLLLLGVISKGAVFKNATLPIFPLGRYIPQSPEVVKICRHCGAVSHMVPLTSQPGIDAYEWHIKKKKLQGE